MRAFLKYVWNNFIVIFQRKKGSIHKFLTIVSFRKGLFLHHKKFMKFINMRQIFQIFVLLSEKEETFYQFIQRYVDE